MTNGTGNSGNANDLVLDIRGLRTYFYTDIGVARALNGVTLQVPGGKVLGVVGESGCGKSVTALSVMQLVPQPGKIVSGSITFNRRRDNQQVESVDLTSLNPRGSAIRSIRGKDIAMIFQEPMTSLNPSYTVGNQIMEAVMLHQMVSKQEALDRSVEMLRRVEMPNPGNVVKQYPHELSGGMRQRVMIAMALSCNPSLLFADEPTTALDVTTEAEILELMRELQASLGMTIVYITHSLGVVAQMCDSVAVMYLGRVMEQGPIISLFHEPKHPYTTALLRSIPVLGRSKERLKPIRGMVPDPYSRIPGCSFYPRCESRIPGTCNQHVPELTNLSREHAVRCFLYSDQWEKADEK